MLERIDPGIPVIVAATLGLLAVMGVVVGGVLLVAFAGDERRRQAFVIVIPVLIAVGASLILMLGLGQVSRDFGGAPQLVDLQSVPPTPIPPRVAEITSDEELLEVAAAAPKIQLDDAKEAKPVEAPDALGEDRPAWLDGGATADQGVFTAGPFSVASESHSVAPEFYDWVWDRAAVRQPDLGPTPPDWWGGAMREVQERMVVATYRERRETSVGTVYLDHTLAEIDPEDQQWLAARADEWLAKSRRERGVQRVAWGGAGLLTLLAIVHGALRSGASRSPRHDRADA